MDSPRSPTDDREAPYCRRCGQYAEPDDWCCWACGGEELILAGQIVPHVYTGHSAGNVRTRAVLDGAVSIAGGKIECRA